MQMISLKSFLSRRCPIFFESCPYLLRASWFVARTLLLHALIERRSEARCVHEIKSLDIYPTSFSYFTPPRVRRAGYRIFRARVAGGRARIWVYTRHKHVHVRASAQSLQKLRANGTTKTDAIQSTTAAKCQITIQKTQQQLKLSLTTAFSVNVSIHVITDRESMQ